MVMMDFDFLDKNGMEELDMGECMVMSAKMDGEEKQGITACRVSEDKWKMKSPEMDMVTTITKKDIEDVEGF